MPLYDDEYDELEDDEIEDRIASLEYQLGISDDEPNGYQPDENELALASQKIADLERSKGVTLDDEDFQRVGELAQQYGDPETAFNMVVAESAEATDAWDRDFEAGVTELEAEIGRKVLSKEREALIDHHEEISDPDVAGAWKSLYGKRYSEDDVKAVQDRFSAEHEEMKTTDVYSEEFIEAWRKETEAKVTAEVEQMQASGKGSVNIDTPEGQSDYITATQTPDEPETEDFDPVTASNSEVEDHIDRALQ